MLSTIRLARSALVAAPRYLSTSAIIRTSAGYGDPQDEKINNNTPQPNANPRDQSFPNGADAGVAKKTGNTSDGGDKEVTEKEIKETKKIGESPKKEKVVIGGCKS